VRPVGADALGRVYWARCRGSRRARCERRCGLRAVRRRGIFPADCAAFLPKKIYFGLKISPM
jgi:hypothetical protein